MLKNRAREWLLEHPEVLTFAFLVVLKWEEYVPGGVTIQGGSSSSLGP